MAGLRGERARQLPAVEQRHLRRQARPRSLLHGRPHRLHELGRADGHHQRRQPGQRPELRFTPSGQPVARFRIASTPRQFDKQSGEWRDGDTLFLTINVWRQAAENAAESGVVGGYPVTDVYVSLYDGSSHDVDSNEMAFKLTWMGCHSDNVRALGSRRILTQNRYPLLLKAQLVAGFFRGYEA